MAGVEILAENVIMSNQCNFAWNGWSIFCYIITGLFVIFTVVLIVVDDDFRYIITGLLAILMLIIGTGIANGKGAEKVYDYTEYKVIVDDTVNMNEFLEKYEILDRDGKIYIVREVIKNE